MDKNAIFTMRGIESRRKKEDTKYKDERDLYLSHRMPEASQSSGLCKTYIFYNNLQSIYIQFLNTKASIVFQGYRRAIPVKARWSSKRTFSLWLPSRSHR